MSDKPAETHNSSGEFGLGLPEFKYKRPNHRARKPSPAKGSAETHSHWKKLLRRCALEPAEDLMRLPEANRIARVRAVYANLHQAFDLIVRTENSGDFHVSTQELVAFCQALQDVVLRAPELSLKKKTEKKLKKRLAAKMLQGGALSQRLQEALGTYVCLPTTSMLL